jgi:hypothetical protein
VTSASLLFYLCSGSLQPCIGSLPYDVPLKLGQGAEDVEDKFSATGGRVYTLGDAFEADFSVVKRCYGFNEMLERPA